MLEERLREDIHDAIDVVSRPAPHLLSSSMGSVRSEPQESQRRLRWIAAAIALLLAVATVEVLIGRPQNPTSPHPGGLGSQGARQDPGPAPWPEDLTISGGVVSSVSETMPNEGSARSSCNGGFANDLHTYTLNLYLPAAGGVIQLSASIPRYRGPGTYAASSYSRDVVAELETSSGEVWWTGIDDPISLTVSPDEESGTIVATLSGLSGEAPVLISGHWTCRTAV